MNYRQALIGKVVHVGNILQQGGPEDCCLLDSIVFRDRAGAITRLTGVVVPGKVHWTLTTGLEGQFELLHLTYPKPFGSYVRSFIVEVKSKDATVDGEDSVRKWISSSKGAFFQYLWFGLILLPAFGFGILLWICAIRLLKISFTKRPLSSGGKGVT